MVRERKHKDMLSNGRNQKGPPKFENWYCRVYPKDFTYPAWRSLAPTAKDVAHICRAKSEHAGASGKKGEGGHPIFEFTAKEARKVFSITEPTFIKAIHTLIGIEYLVIVRHGGTLDGKGISNLYRLTDKWKEWTPPPRDNANIMKARAARGKR